MAMAACGGSDDPSDGSRAFPDVVAATGSADTDGTYTFAATISSPYDTAEQYADGWRVIGPDGTTYGTRVLTHPHADEQPFTRSLSGIDIPDDVSIVVVQARDLLNGWGGATVEIQVG